MDNGVHFMRFVAILTAVIMVCSCSHTPDPHAGGVVNSVSRNLFGGWKRYHAAQRDELERILEQQTQAEEERERIETERARIRKSMDQTRGRIKTLKERIAAARASPPLRAASQSEKRRKLDQAQGIVDSARQEAASVNVETGSAEELQTASDSISESLSEADRLIKESLLL